MDLRTDDDYDRELKRRFPDENFDRINKIDSMYITNRENRDMSNDTRIFWETQGKRLMRGYISARVPKNVKSKLVYFSRGEDKDGKNIYKYDKMRELQSKENYAIRNIGHATLLIKLHGCNILTDPVFSHLSKLFYPEKTMSHPSVENLPRIDVVIISHNHRDHVDESSLKALIKHQTARNNPMPKILVPLGNKTLFRNIGFVDIVEVDWYTKITFGSFHFISIPADHRSGRNGLDHHKSLVTGWIINPKHENVIIKFSGDTRALTDKKQLAIDSILWNEIKYHKLMNSYDDVDVKIPDIICLEPSGPNYTRCEMDKTHQSTSYSALLKFIDAKNLAMLSGRGKIKEFLPKLKTILMHHNKFELGPDRFNEGLFITKKLINYLNLTEVELMREGERQRRKWKPADGANKKTDDRKRLIKETRITAMPIIYTLPRHTSLLVRAKDFIIDDIQFIAGKLEGILNKWQLRHFIIKNTIFPKIGERLNNKSIHNSKFDVEKIEKYEMKNFVSNE